MKPLLANIPIRHMNIFMWVNKSLTKGVFDEENFDDTQSVISAA